jgi:ketosteroid isomerase-like protein
VLHLRQDIAMCSAIATQAIGDDAPGLVLQASEQPLEEALRRCDVPAVLDQDVEHDAVLIDRTPEIYSAHARIRKFWGEMTRKLSDTASQ